MIGDKLMATGFEHLDETVETVAHLLAAVVLDDKGHLELRVGLELEELPGVEVGDEVAILVKYATHQHMIKRLGQVVERQPEQREADEGRDGGWDLHDTILHEPCAGFGEVHITTWDEGGVERRVVTITHALDLRLDDGEHTGLTIAIDRKSGDALDNLLRTGEVGLLRLPVINPMTSHFVTLGDDALHDLWGMLSEVTRTEERGAHTVLLQDIEDTTGADLRDGHPLLQREVNAMLARHVELFCIKTQ